MYCRSRKYLLFIIYYLSFVLCITSCSDPRRFRIRGDINNLQQAEFYIYSPDGGLNKLDTITVEDGAFKWQTLLDNEAIFYLVYPNLSQQVIFARPGEDIRVVGDASQLRAINVLGSDENKAYTEFRMAHFSDRPEQLAKAMNEFIADHPDSRVSTYMKSQRTASAGRSAGVGVGDRLPNITLPPDGITPDSSTIEVKEGRPVLLTFWASWVPECRQDFYYILSAHNQSKQLTGEHKLRIISVSLDAEEKAYRGSLKYDSLVWESRCYRQLWDTPVVSQLSISELPYYILADAKLNIVASGSNWRDDIQRDLFRLTISERH